MADELYADPARVKAAITPITGQGRGGHSLDEGRIIANILDVQAEVDARLGGRYDVPFPAYDEDPPTPPLVREITQDIAIYLCTIEARGSADMKKDDPVVRRYERKQKMLEDIAAGNVDLPGVDHDVDFGGFAAVNTVPCPEWSWP